MPSLKLEPLRGSVAEARKSVAAIEKLLNKTTPDDVRGDLKMHLQSANQHLAWALASLRKSEIDSSVRRQYVPGGD